jgi:two-component system, chemotaxis family, chemotaxis protein CheY
MPSTVMVVDDSQMVRQQVGRTLASAGYTIVEAHDGADALTKLSSGLALIVLDVNMPNMSGLEFLQSLRTRPDCAAVPVVMLTTEGQPQLMKQAKELGAKGWIVKPFKPDLLLAAVKKLAQAG